MREDQDAHLEVLCTEVLEFCGGKNMSKKERVEEKVKIKDRVKNLLLFLPNLVLLLGALLKDKRVPIAEKALFVAAIAYVLSPLDFIPDIFPFIGQVDDIYLVALTILRLINYTDEQVVREHWRGGGDIVELAETIANLAPIILPKRVSRVITSKIEIKEVDKILLSIKDKEPILKEIPSQDRANL
ncbi:MAG: DUF1232 domain-containing protein [Acidobacteria bacterium]|nr:MAG: DUF1232 domain-containing protein [Acidobacteriota bacterium]